MMKTYYICIKLKHFIITSMDANSLTDAYIVTNKVKKSLGLRAQHSVGSTNNTNEMDCFSKEHQLPTYQHIIPEGNKTPIVAHNSCNLIAITLLIPRKSWSTAIWREEICWGALLLAIWSTKLMIITQRWWTRSTRNDVLVIEKKWPIKVLFSHTFCFIYYYLNAVHEPALSGVIYGHTNYYELCGGQRMGKHSHLIRNVIALPNGI